MLIENIEELQSAITARKSGIEVIDEAFDFCDQIRLEEVLGSGADWSIAVTHGWMAIITTFNHNIHRKFMSQEKRDREDLQHIIRVKYIIKKTTDKNKYELVLRPKKD